LNGCSETARTGGPFVVAHRRPTTECPNVACDAEPSRAPLMIFARTTSGLVQHESKSVVVPGSSRHAASLARARADMTKTGTVSMVGDRIVELCRELERQFEKVIFDLSVTHNGATGVRLRPKSFRGSRDGPERYDIGCIQTLAEGLVVASVAADGLIDVDAPVGEYLPELSREGSRPGDRIRVRDLMSHATGYHATSGIPARAGFRSWREFLDYLSHAKPSFPPGTICSWNGLGRLMLLPAIERATGAPLHALLRSRVAEITGHEPDISNVESGWPRFLISIDDLVAYVRGTLNSDWLQKKLRDCTIPVVRNPISSRSNAPIAYSFGLALYPEGLWGQTGNSADYNLGIKFNDTGSFCTALALGASPFGRDLALQYVCTAAGYTRRNSAPRVMGSIIGLSPDELSGVYFGDRGDEINVVGGEEITCTFVRDKAHVATIRLKADNESIIGDGRWDMHQVEFFKHPDTGDTCLTFGQICYLKDSSLGQTQNL